MMFAQASVITLLTNLGPVSSRTSVMIGLIENLFKDLNLPFLYAVTIVDLTVQFD